MSHKQSERAKWSNRAGRVLDLTSYYWESRGGAETEEELDEYLRVMEEEYDPFKEAVQEADSYDDLSPEVKLLFDQVEKAQADYEAFLERDTGGMGRFHDDQRASPGPASQPPPAAPPGP